MDRYQTIRRNPQTVYGKGMQRNDRMPHQPSSQNCQGEQNRQNHPSSKMPDCGCKEATPYGDMEAEDACDMTKERLCKRKQRVKESKMTPVGMGYVPWQIWEETLDAAKGLSEGSIFPELILPFEGGRC